MEAAMIPAKDERSVPVDMVNEMKVDCNIGEGEQEDNGHHIRGQWSSRLDYIMSMVGFCVGFGNLWRFPYICNRNGGGAFLIPFIFFLIVTTLPMFYLESCLGQFSGKGAIHVWSFCPLLKGVGIGTVIQVIICLPYYDILLAWPIYYMVKSCSSVLPWTTCGNWWNTELCIEDIYSAGGQDSNRHLVNTTFYNVTLTYQRNVNVRITDLWRNKTLAHSAVEEFYQYNVLGISSGLHEIGSIQWHTVGCLFASYLVIFLCLFRGVKATGKVWLEACLQVFYSVGPGWGILLTSSSYNRFHNPILRDSFILCIISEGTSIFAGFVTFSILGVMADKTGVAISEVVSSGPGLGFVAYTEALAQLPLPQLWSFLFFFMLLAIGLDSQFLFAEIISTAIIDQYPRTLRQRRGLVTACLCGCAFLLGVVICTQGGPYIFQLLDWYLVAVSLFLICFLECISSVWFYGIHQLSEDVNHMLGRPLSVWVKILWGIITPSILLVVMCMTLLKYQPPTYGTYVYPHYASVIGWIIAMLPVIPIPIVMINVIRKQNGSSLKEKLMLSLLPDSKWRSNQQRSAANYRERLLMNRKTFKEKFQFLFQSKG